MSKKANPSLSDLFGNIEEQMKNLTSIGHAVMATQKNFKILQKQVASAVTSEQLGRKKILMSELSFGSKFARNGDECMRLRPAGHLTMSALVSENLAHGKILIANLRTGSVWFVSDEVVYVVV